MPLEGINLGLCCLNITLKNSNPSVYPSRTMIAKTVDTLGVEEAKRRCLLNLEDVLTMLRWNRDRGIKVFRLSSDLFPQKNNPKTPDYSFDFARKLLRKIGRRANRYGHRLTFHPNHFNVLATPNDKALQSTIADLTYHADMMEIMELPKDSVMVIHGGGVYGDKDTTKKRWCERYERLPDYVRERLVLENCEKNFSIEDCLEISEKCGVPVVFDVFHHTCYITLHPEEDLKNHSYYIPKVLESWKKAGIKPKFHLSEQRPGMKLGAHSDYVDTIPDYLLAIPEKYGVDIDIMIEAKMKELAVLKLYKEYK